MHTHRRTPKEARCKTASIQSGGPRSRRARLLALAALASGVLVAGCGGSSGEPDRGDGGRREHPPASSTASAARRQRARAPPRRRRRPGAGVRPSACAPTACPTFRTRARGADCSSSACRNESGVACGQGGAGEVQEAAARWPPGPGSTTHPSAQTLAKLRRIAVCMREHGVPQFPDPGPPSRPTSTRPVRRDHRFRRSDPPVPGHDRHAVAGLQAGLGRVRGAAPRPPH